MEEQRRTNAAVLELLQKKNDPPPAPARRPEFTEDEIRDKPLEVMSRMVGFEVTSAVDKLKGDIASQLTPINNFIASSQRNNALDGYIAQLKSNPVFHKLNDPNIEMVFRQALASHPGEITTNVVQMLYLAAVGAVAANLIPQPTNSSPNPPSAIPAHVRPNPAPSDRSGLPSLPILDANEERIRKERGWSHARACYAFEKIPASVYKKHEPDAKLIPGMKNNDI